MVIEESGIPSNVMLHSYIYIKSILLQSSVPAVKSMHYPSKSVQTALYHFLRMMTKVSAFTKLKKEKKNLFRQPNQQYSF